MPFFVFVICLLVTASSGSADETPEALTLSFVDESWDGVTIPKGQQCREFGGNGQSPRIRVENIPLKATALIVEFSDETYKPCDNGGHGIVKYEILEGVEVVEVPSIQGQTFQLPDGFTLIKEHCGRSLGMVPGAYIGPCLGVRNNYYVTITAIRLGNPPSNSQPLAQGKLGLGTYKRE